MTHGLLEWGGGGGVLGGAEHIMYMKFSSVNLYMWLTTDYEFS